MVSFNLDLTEKNQKNIRKIFQQNGVFYSDDKLAQIVKSYIPEDVTEVYDPTAGAGSLLAVFGDDVKKYGQELDPNQAKACQEIPNCECVAGDTLSAPAFMDRKFSAIVANPPFSVKYDADNYTQDPRFIYGIAPRSKADWAFIQHIIYMLADNGTAAVVLPMGILFRGQREGQIRQKVIEANLIDSVTAYPGGHFIDTPIPIVVVVFKKNRQRTDITITDTEINKSRDVPFEELKANDFNLNVSRYVWADVIQEEYDITAEVNNLYSIITDSLKSGLDCCKMIETLRDETGRKVGDISKLLTDLRGVLNDFK